MSMLRSLSVALPLLLVSPLMFAEPAWAADAESEDGAEEKTYDYGFKVKIEVRMENGTTVKHRGEIRTMDTDWSFDFEGADHKHVVVLSTKAEEGDKVVDLTLAYNRDGMDMIAPYTSKWKVRKRETLWTTDGSLAVAIILIPTRFEREDTSRDDKDKIAPDDNDDPLGDNLFK
ncbi:hypothetical protein G6O69_23905 [Pseudenhygromyxa sp. WMMC2535]|uniref:hypothetical protein n=1 Tax=Pseudenhygromyxa sp. WMMC2535 TaxID=2712867 RepID=UPI00155638D1|nr:hypothetical protein [Pseudenhygromyxa sp. WMMC2535]NVB40905.1 hypothetical protein [Pseudenhygromyxa sp. WMMC2535]